MENRTESHKLVLETRAFLFQVLTKIIQEISVNTGGRSQQLDSGYLSHWQNSMIKKKKERKKERIIHKSSC